VINLDESIRAIYFIGGQRHDWLCAVNVNADGTTASIVYRFRFYDPQQPDNDAWSDRDQKAWFRAEAESVEQALAGAQRVYDGLLEGGFVAGPDVQAYVLRRNELTLADFWEAFKQAPFVHARTVPPPAP
jgi:hypothetical protein